MYRSRKAEKRVLDLYIALPLNLRQFTFDVKRAVLTLENCAVLPFSEFAERNDCNKEEVFAYCKSHTGCVKKDEETGNYIILYNDYPNMTPEGQAYILAHELSHILLGHMEILEKYKLYNSNYSNEHFEREANYCAACMQCPYPILSKLKPKSKLAVKGIFGLTDNVAKISLNNYKHYDKSYNIAWHNDIIKLFDFQCDLLEIYTYKLDVACETGAEIMPKIKPETKKKERTYLTKKEVAKNKAAFEKLEDDWLYPKSLGLS